MECAVTEPAEAILTLAEAEALAQKVLASAGFSPAQAAPITRMMVMAEADNCRSHGLYRLLGYVRTARAGKAVLDAVPTVSHPAPGLVRVDAGRGFAPLAFDTGMPHLIEKARGQGIAALAINRCFHFHALWAEVEPLAEAGLVALALTPSHAWVSPAGGSKPLFGTNPIAFGWPRRGQNPFVFDFATSAVARGEIELHARAGKPIPEGWAVGRDGQPTTDPVEALKGAMLTFGGHKGSALSAMVELMAGPMIGDLLSTESLAFDAGADGAPFHGELILALDPAAFLGGMLESELERAEGFFARYAATGARLPSARRYAARQVTGRAGFAMPGKLLDDLTALA